MKKRFKKLSLNTETLRVLDPHDLTGVVGEQAAATGTVGDTLCTVACTLCTVACTLCTACASACASC